MDYTGGVVSFIHNDKNLLKCDVVILDEMSMVDVKLFQAPHCGTAVQLPYYYGRRRRPAAQRRPGQYPRRDHPFRAGADGLPQRDIPAGRSEPHRGECPPHHLRRTAEKGGKTDDFFFLEADGDAAQKLVCDLVTTRLPRSYQFDPVKDIQVLCPTKLGPTGTQALNAELQAMLNPPKKGKPELQSAARVFRVGTK